MHFLLFLSAWACNLPNISLREFKRLRGESFRIPYRITSSYMHPLLDVGEMNTSETNGLSVHQCDSGSVPFQNCRPNSLAEYIRYTNSGGSQVLWGETWNPEFKKFCNRHFRRHNVKVYAGMMGKGRGLDVHSHQSVINMVLFGTKYWTLSRGRECSIRGGDMIFVPRNWKHSTLSLEFTY